MLSLHSRNAEELNEENLAKIFYPCPEGIPKEDIYTYVRPMDSEELILTQTEWYIFWTHMTYNDYVKAYKLLTYLGL